MQTFTIIRLFVFFFLCSQLSFTSRLYIHYWDYMYSFYFHFIPFHKTNQNVFALSVYVSVWPLQPINKHTEFTCPIVIQFSYNYYYNFLKKCIPLPLIDFLQRNSVPIKTLWIFKNAFHKKKSLFYYLTNKLQGTLSI